MRKLLLACLVTSLVSPAGAAEEDFQTLSSKMHYFTSLDEGKTVDKDLTATIVSWSGDMKSHPTANNFGTSTLHGYIQPQFVDAIFAREGQEVLEVGPADGLLLEIILKDPRNEQIPIRYTVVEPSAEHLTAIDKIIMTWNKNKENWFGKAKKGDVREFIKDKEKKYDLILCSQVLHFFDPVDQLAVLCGFRRSLKDGGQLFLITNGLFSINLWVKGRSEIDTKTISESYITTVLENQKQGDLWPGYGFKTEFMAQWIQLKTLQGYGYDVPTFHSITSMKGLLQAVGFDVTDCCNFTERLSYPDSGESSYESVPSIRLGAIARKAVADQKTLEKYKDQATKKRTCKIGYERFMKENMSLILSLASMMEETGGTH